MRGLIWAALLVLGAPALAGAQEAPAQSTTVLPTGTNLVIRVDEAIDSYTIRRGARFRIRLVEPVKAGQATLLPAGLTGEGEVVHSEPAGDRGRPGELHLAARFLNYGDRKIALKGWRISAKGREEIETDARSITYIGYPAVVGPGAAASAELAEDFDLRSGLGAPPPPVQPERLAGALPGGLSRPSLGRAQVVFFRSPHSMGFLNSFKVRYGPGKGDEVGQLGNGRFFVVQVEPGIREFTAAQEISDSVFLDVEAGETYFVSSKLLIGVWGAHPNLFPVDRAAFETALPKLKQTKTAKKQPVLQQRTKAG